MLGASIGAGLGVSQPTRAGFLVAGGAGLASGAVAPWDWLGRQVVMCHVYVRAQMHWHG